MKKLKKELQKSNPMEDSEYCYYQTFGKALVGLEKALGIRDGEINKVTTNDILDYAEDVDKEEFEFLFGDPKGLVDDTQKEIEKTFKEADTMLEGLSEEAQLSAIFERFRRNSPMIRVMLLLDKHVFWRGCLKTLAQRLALHWPPAETEAWEYLFTNFCCQFSSVLEKWETSDFSKDHLYDCVRLTQVWLEADGMLGDTVGELLLGSWAPSK